MRGKKPPAYVPPRFGWDPAERQERMGNIRERMRDGVSGVARSYPDAPSSASAGGSTDVARPASPHRGAKVLFGGLFWRPMMHTVPNWDLECYTLGQHSGGQQLEASPVPD